MDQANQIEDSDGPNSQEHEKSDQIEAAANEQQVVSTIFDHFSASRRDCKNPLWDTGQNNAKIKEKIAQEGAILA